MAEAALVPGGIGGLEVEFVVAQRQGNVAKLKLAVAIGGGGGASFEQPHFSVRLALAHERHQG